MLWLLPQGLHGDESFVRTSPTAVFTRTPLNFGANPSWDSGPVGPPGDWGSLRCGGIVMSAYLPGGASTRWAPTPFVRRRGTRGTFPGVAKPGIAALWARAAAQHRECTRRDCGLPTPPISISDLPEVVVGSDGLRVYAGCTATTYLRSRSRWR